jgi:rhodanese-related sulfurtransferase
MKHSPGFLKLVNDAKNRIKEISVAQVKTKFKQRADFLFIDTREDHEWNKAHAAGAIHLSKGIIEREIEGAVPDKNKLMVLYCGGGYRSALAADNLRKMGYKNVFSLAGGWRAWTRGKGKIRNQKAI